jgi:hypothetical protein
MSFSDNFGQANVIGGTVPTLVMPAGSMREVYRLTNVGASTIYLGGAAVTTANGYPLAAGAEFVGVGPSAVYGIVASGTIDVRYYYSA